MDYSAISHQDPENPTGSSPWASPGPNQAAFSESNNSDIPPSPLPPQQQQSPYDAAQDLSQAANAQPWSSGNDKNPDTPDLAGGLQSATLGGVSDSAVEQPPYATTQPPPPQQPQYAPQQQQQQQQQQFQGPARYQTPARHNDKQPTPLYRIQAKITGLERTGKKDPILRFDVHTNIPKFRTTQYRDVRRTHVEFVRLAEHLMSANPEALVPAVPPPLTPAGAGTEEDEVRVKASMQRWVNIVLSNETLIQDDEVVLFVESDFGYSPVVRMKQPATGMRRKVLKQFAPPPDDTPELQSARPVVKMFYLGAMDASQKVDRVVKGRRGLGLAETDFGMKLAQMHVQETHPGLANAYKKLGKIIQTEGDYHAVQATAEATTLGDPLNYHSSDALIVKETLTNRHILLRDLLQAQQTAHSKRAAADRLRVSSSVRPDKVDEALHALEEADNNESYLSKRTQRVTANLLQEKRRWFEQTSSDILTNLREYTLRQIEAERRTLATLENVRPDIRAIDASGGLSRLGREAHPTTARRPNLGSSQGPKGDAWSGVPRRSDGLGRSLSGSIISSPTGENEEETDASGTGKGRVRSSSGVGSIAEEEDDEDRLDARNAASRLAASTF